MEHTVEKLSSNKVKISFKVPSATFEEAVQKAYLKMRGSINVPGFRKGKAPRNLIERMYGATIFYDDALDAIFPDAYMSVVKESDLKPVSRPELDIQEMEKGKDLAFSCEVYVQPDVQLGDYKGLEVTRVIREISEDEVNARLTQEQKRSARSIEMTEGSVENGDVVNLDYSGSVDGEKFDGGTAEGQQLKIGSGSFIPGFEEQMIGMEIGSERDLTVKFPDQYHSKELEGKDAVFHVKVNGISREELPELDDEFASEVSDFDTLDEYKADIRANLQKAADAESMEAAKQSLVDAAVKNAEVDIPDPMIEDKLNEMMEQMSWRMQQQGFTMKKYMELLGQSEQQMRDMYREEAKNSLKSELVLDEIVKAEGFETDEKDVDGMLSEYASTMGRTLEEMKEKLSEGQLEYFAHRSKVNQALDLLWDQAKVTEQSAEEAAKEREAKAKETDNASEASETPEASKSVDA